MREISVRNLTSGDLRKRDCRITEYMRQGEYSTTVVRRCTYRVESQTTLASQEDTIDWAKNFDPINPRRVYVRKSADPETGAEKVIYKVMGYLYAVKDSTVFCVGYRHILAMDIVEEFPFAPEG